MKPQSPELPPGNENATGSDCGEKFRAMLRCVERDAAIPPCTHAINVFLACERAVFRSALNAQPPHKSNSGQSNGPLSARGTARGTRDFPHGVEESESVAPSSGTVGSDARPLTRKSPRDHAQDELPKHYPRQPASDWLHFPSRSMLEFVQRAVEKQAGACVKLIQVTAQPDYPQRLTSFCKRIAQDIHLSFSLVAQKVVTIVRSERDSKD